MTITLAAVFVPLAFSTGNTGKLFTEFALTVAAAVLVSGFVALTLTPMMCSKLLSTTPRTARSTTRLERFFAALNVGLPPLAALRRSATAGRGRRAIRGVSVAAMVGFGATLKSELAPLEDRGFFLGVMLAPEGSTMDYTDGYARIWEDIYKERAGDRELFRGGRARARPAQPGQLRASPSCA